MRKFFGLGLASAMLAGALAGGAAAQEAPKSIKIGYAISLSGPQSAGAMLTTVPNYRLWVDEINKAGGLMLKKYNKKIPIEVTEIDDRSNNEDMVRLVEKLMSVDKVDLVLTPLERGSRPAGCSDFRQVRLSADHGNRGKQQARGAGEASSRPCSGSWPNRTTR